MKIYEVEGKTFAVIDGELFQRMKPRASIITDHPELVIVRAEKKIKIKAIKIPQEGQHKRVGGADGEKIRALILEGKLSNAEIAIQFGVTAGAIYNYRWRMQKSGEVKGSKGKDMTVLRDNKPERINYICENGDRFKSNLEIGVARCPNCKSTTLRIDVEPPVREEQIHSPGSTGIV